jgi:hypothetical protein
MLLSDADASSLLNSTYDFNSQVQDEYAAGNDVVLPTTSDDIPLFSDSKTAAIYAMNKFNNYSSFEMLSDADVLMTAIGKSLMMKVQMHTIKYNSGNYYMEIERYQMTPSGLIDFGLTHGYKWYYKQGKHYEMVTKNVSKYGNDLYAYYYNYRYNKKWDSLTNQINFYKIDNSTISSGSNFQVVYHPISNKIVQYQLTVEINPVLATRDYVKHYQEQSYIYNHVYKSLTIHMVLSNTGDIMTIRAEEEYNGEGDWKGIPYSVNFKDIFNYTLVSYNETPSVSEPIL